MKIYKISEDTNEVQWVLPRVPEDMILDLLTFDCELKGRVFDDIDWYIYNPKENESNFYMGITGALVFDKKVYNSEMYAVLEMGGEILKLNMENGKELFVLNVMECVNILDYSKTTWNFYEDGSQGRILKYAFHDQGISESSIFKIPETSRVDIFAYSGTKYEGDEFYSLYKKVRLYRFDFRRDNCYRIKGKCSLG